MWVDFISNIVATWVLLIKDNILENDIGLWWMSERKHVMWNTSNMTFLDLACFCHFLGFKTCLKIMDFLFIVWYWSSL